MNFEHMVGAFGLGCLFTNGLYLLFGWIFPKHPPSNAPLDPNDWRYMK